MYSKSSGSLFWNSLQSIGRELYTVFSLGSQWDFTILQPSNQIITLWFADLPLSLFFSHHYHFKNFVFTAYALKFLVYVKIYTRTSNHCVAQVWTSSLPNWCGPKIFSLARFHCIPNTHHKFICVKFKNKKKNNNHIYKDPQTGSDQVTDLIQYFWKTVDWST